MNHPSHYRNKEVVILGLARSGVAAAKLFYDMGAKVVVNDKKERNVCPEADELEALGISVICGGHPESLIHPGVSLIVKNPGIPYFVAPIVHAERLGVEIVTEVEVAYYVSDAPMICITGSNGKTTTTTWIGEIMSAAGLNPIVAGNIGRALCDAALEATADDRLVVELSSFQLKGIDQFRPSIACLLNIYETHLDYHGTLDDYIASKAKLFKNQTEQDTAVFNWDDPICRQIAAGIRAKIVPFSTKEQLPFGVYVDSMDASDHVSSIMFRDEQGDVHTIVPTKELGILGKHNLEDALAATAVAVSAGAPLNVIADVLRSFRGVEHRQEFVASRNEVAFYNDSKATNPSATIKAIEAFEQPIVLIAGGLDRKSDYMELLPLFKQKIKAVVTLGETREKINRVAQLAGVAVHTIEPGQKPEETIAEAVRIANSLAEPGDVVLFSPACASWDMFSSYEVRGRIFKESVHNL